MKLFESLMLQAGSEMARSDVGKFDYGLEIVFAVTTSLVVATLFLFVKIKFGTEYEITHLSTTPYLIAMVLFAFIMVEILFFLFMLEIVYAGKFDQFSRGVFGPNLGYRIVIMFLTCGKVTMMLLFYLQRAFENTILSGFIQFQHQLRLEELDIVKDAYQRQEKGFLRGVKTRRTVLCICMLAYLIYGVYLTKHHTDVGLLMIAVGLLPYVGIMFALGRYCTSTARLLYDMQWGPRFAFNSHITRLGLTFVLQVVCILAFLERQVFEFLQWICIFSRFPDSGLEWMYDETAEDPGFCTYFINAFEKQNSGVKAFSQWICAEDAILLMPVFFFFILDRPHDCFKCVGKDPSRIYSTYQLTREETAQRMLSAKVGPKDSEFKRRAQKQLIEKIVAGETDRRVTVVTTTIDGQQLIPLPGEKQPIIDELVYRYGGSTRSIEEDDVPSYRYSEAVQNDSADSD